MSFSFFSIWFYKTVSSSFQQVKCSTNLVFLSLAAAAAVVCGDE